MNDLLLLIGRVLIALLFLMIVWVGGPSAGYLTSLGFFAPAACSLVAHIVEWIIIVSLIFGLWTRWSALLGIAFVLIATATAHRYWELTPPAQQAQYANFAKNLAILGALLFVYVTGPGAYSLDRMWLKKRAA
ncbi:MAG: DoxX family protein [Alphaproteobacteria bacterium]|nr:DoxX family protein [Alphaproteobacteria bacterium]